MKSKKMGLTLVLIACMGCGAAAYFFYPRPPKIAPGKIAGRVNSVTAPPHQSIAVVESIPDWYEAVGTIRPQTENVVAAQISAQVRQVNVRPGDTVTKGQVLVVLDDRQLKARLDQAKQARQRAISGKAQARQAMAAAQAGFNQAEAAYTRVKTYVASQAATKQDLEQAESAYLQARAGLQRAKDGLTGADAAIGQADEVVREAEIALGYARIRATAAGEVLNRMVEPGDLASPGKPLLVLQTANALRMEAYVREGLISRIKPGDRLTVYIETVGKTVDAVVEEIVPYADPQSRTFLVKAALPEIDGIYPGMYGKLRIPEQMVSVVLIPASAIRRVGQLELVSVQTGSGWQDRYVQTGRHIGDRVEILSGLDGNETVGWGAPPA